MPVMRSTYSLRTSTAWLTTHWTSPVWSRRSRKARCSPCSRRRATQPQRLTVRPASLARRVPHWSVRMLVGRPVLMTATTPGPRRRAPVRGTASCRRSPCWSSDRRARSVTTPAASSSGPTITATSAPERSAAFIWLFMLRWSNDRSAAMPAARSSAARASASCPPRRVDDVDLDPRRGGREHALGIAGQQDPLDPRAEADAARPGRAAQGLDQPVVATATTDGVLRRVERVGRELEQRVVVVVEPADQPGLDLVRDPEDLQPLLHPIEARLRVRREVLQHLGRRGHHGLVLRPSGVQDPQRVERQRLPALLGEVGGVALQVGGQRGQVRGPAGVVAQRVDDQPSLGQPEGAVEAVEEGDDLDVGIRVVRPDDLGVDLEVLPVAGRLRGLVAEVGAGRPRLPRHGRVVLGEGPHEPGRDLRAHRDPPAALVLEVVHLLADDVGRLADPLEHLEVLDQRCDDQAEPGPLGQTGEDGQQPRPALGLRREHVGHAAGSLEVGHEGPG